jgi:hypothetical protein
MTHGSISTNLPKCINDLHVLMLMSFCFCSWRLKAFFFVLGSWRFLSLLLERFKVLLLLLNVEGFCCFFWMLKVLAHTFGCWRLLLLLFDVKSYYFSSWMFKVPTFGFRCWKFLLLHLDIEGFYFVLGCWRFVLILSLLFICIY